MSWVDGVVVSYGDAGGLLSPCFIIMGGDWMIYCGVLGWGEWGLLGLWGESGIWLDAGYFSGVWGGGR